MNLTFTPIKEKKVVSCYQVYINYEHGDADKTTTSVEKLKDKTQEQIIAYIEKFNELAEAIDDNRGYSKELPEELIKNGFVLVEKGLSIEPELDIFARDSMSDYYAAISINKIEFIDEKGQKFNVAWN